MPRQTVNNSALVSVRGHVGAQRVENTFCYQTIAGGITASKVDALADWWLPTGWDQIKLVLPSAFVLDDILVQSLDPGLLYQTDRTPSGTVTGSRGGEVEQGVTAPINWETLVPSRSSRGRTSIGPVLENDVNGENIGTVLVNLLISFAAFLIVQHPAGEWTFSVGSRKLHIPFEIVSGIVRGLVGSMNSRLTRR